MNVRRRGLDARLIPSIFGVSIACVSIAVVVSYGWYIWQVIPALMSADVEYVRELMARGEREQCERSPEDWSIAMKQDLHLYAYDRETYESQNPAAFAIDASERASHRRGDDLTMRLYAPWYRPLGERPMGGVLLVDLGGRGPCSMVMVAWPIRVGNRLRLGFSALVVLVLLMSAFTAFIIHSFVTRPLVGRIRALNRRAEEVGTRDGAIDVATEQRDDELGEIAHTLERVHGRIREDARTLEERREALERHITEVTHDLKTPMTSLSLALQDLADRDPEADAALTLAMSELVYMSGLVTNLRMAVTLRDTDAVSLDSELCLNEVLERITARHLVLARRRGVSLDCAYPDERVVVSGHAVMIEQALTNLVQNAVAYNDDGGHVALILEPTSSGHRIRCIDDGPGVAPEHLEHLSQRTFRTGEARQRNPEGDGLGLAIAQAICERHGWEMRISANEPRGLVVEILLGA